MIGIDLGGTKVEACLLDAERNVLSRVRRPSEPTRGLDRVCANIHAVVAEAAGERPYATIGMVTPGTSLPPPTRSMAVRSLSLTKLPVSLAACAANFRPLAVDNDANRLALANISPFLKLARGEFSSRRSRFAEGRRPLPLRIGDYPRQGFGSGLILDGKLIAARSARRARSGIVP